MKIIELLIKATNNEELPKKIKWGANEFIYNGNDYTHTEFGTKFLNRLEINNLYLDDEIEIIEEDKEIEELEIEKLLQTKKWKRDKKAWNKINELVKAVNELKNTNK